MVAEVVLDDDDSFVYNEDDAYLIGGASEGTCDVIFESSVKNGYDGLYTYQGIKNGRPYYQFDEFTLEYDPNVDGGTWCVKKGDEIWTKATIGGKPAQSASDFHSGMQWQTVNGFFASDADFRVDDLEIYCYGLPYTDATFHRVSFYNFLISESASSLEEEGKLMDTGYYATQSGVICDYGEHSCTNGLQDGDEEGRDCGGSCGFCPCDTLMIDLADDLRLNTAYHRIQNTLLNARPVYVSTDGKIYIYNLHKGGWFIGLRKGSATNYIAKTAHVDESWTPNDARRWRINNIGQKLFIKCYACDVVRATGQNTPYPLFFTEKSGGLWYRQEGLFKGKHYYYNKFKHANVFYFYYSHNNNYKLGYGPYNDTYFSLVKIPANLQYFRMEDMSSSTTVNYIDGPDPNGIETIVNMECNPCPAIKITGLTVGLPQINGYWEVLDDYYLKRPAYKHMAYQLYIYYAGEAWVIGNKLGAQEAFAYLTSSNMGYIPLGQFATNFFTWKVATSNTKWETINSDDITIECIEIFETDNDCYNYQNITCMVHPKCRYCSTSDLGGNHCGSLDDDINCLPDPENPPIIDIGPGPIIRCDNFCGIYFDSCIYNQDSLQTECTCTNGYTGEHCDEPPFVEQNIITDDDKDDENISDDSGKSTMLYIFYFVSYY